MAVSKFTCWFRWSMFIHACFIVCLWVFNCIRWKTIRFCTHYSWKINGLLYIIYRTLYASTHSITVLFLTVKLRSFYFLWSPIIIFVLFYFSLRIQILYLSSFFQNFCIFNHKFLYVIFHWFFFNDVLRVFCFLLAHSLSMNIKWFVSFILIPIIIFIIQTFS